MTVALLVTRPQPAADVTAAALRMQGHEVIVAPLLRIEAADFELGPGPWSAVVLTSANAAHAISGFKRRAELTRLPAIVAGQRSADAARAVGFRHIVAKEGGVAGLARLVKASIGERRHPLLYLAGEDRAGDLAADLATEGLVVETVVVYRAVRASTLPHAAQQAIAAGRVGGVLHFSRRSAEAFLASSAASGLPDQVRSLRHYCMSARVAEPLRAAGARDVRVATRPDEAAVLRLIEPVPPPPNPSPASGGG